MDINNTAATMRRLDDAEFGTFQRSETSGVGGGFSHSGTLHYQIQSQRRAHSSAAASSSGKIVTTVMNLDWWAKAAMLLAVVQLIVLLICESLVMTSHLAELDALMAINSTSPGWLLLVNETSNSIIPFSEADTIYEGIFIAAQIFMVYLAFDAIISSSKIQLIATTVFSLAMFGYSCEQYVQSENLVTSSAIGATHYGFLQAYGFQFHRTAPYEIVVIAAGLLFFLVWCFFAFKLYKLFGWSVFKELGADVEVRKRLTLYHIYMMLLKLDVFFFLSFVIQYVLLVFGDTNSMAKTVTIVVSPIAVVVLLLIAYFAVTRESNLLMTFLLIGLSGGVGYLVDRVIDIWTVTDPTKYKSSKTSLTLFTILTLIAALTTFAIAVLNFLNFGKGLMQSLKNKRTPVHTIERQNPLEMPAISPAVTNMEYRFLGRSGLKVSVLSLGGWVTYGGQVGEDIAEQCLKEAYDNGINFFDNAEVYANGKSEIAMGKAIKKFGWKRSTYVISTKIYWGGDTVNEKGLSRKHIVEGTKAALERLQLDYVDLVFAHRPDTDTPIEEIVRAFNHVIERGWAFYWGTSEWSAEQLTDAHRIAEKLGLIGPLMEQPQYNMFHRERFEKEYAPLYEKHGLGTTIWSPLASGILTGKYNSGEIPSDSRLAMKDNAVMKRIAAGLETPEGREKLEKVSKLQPIAEKLGCSLAQLALAWCITNPNVSTVITGASKASQVTENIKALAVVPKLTVEVLAEIEAILANKPAAEAKFR
ncbi:hypothetical protein HDU83_002454 [Entophlyctis luteolus]|nr:hypothetical protein HDU83_002454 [Entophlyctis luteolus]